MKIFSSRSVRYLPVILVVLAAFLFAAPFCQAASSKKSSKENRVSSAKISKPDYVRMTRLLTSVNYFRQVCMRDYRDALFLFAEDAAIQKFRIFDEKIWIQTAPLAGWSYFMSVSVHTVGSSGSNHPLVSFYNPWSDVFLLTVWDIAGEIPRIVDAEMILGDWIRKDSVLSYTPAWLRSDLFKPAALGMSLAEAVKSFEYTFSDVSVDNWRHKSIVLSDQRLLNDVNYPMIAVRLYSSLKAMDNFRFAGKNNPHMESCRNKTIDTIKSAAQGRMTDLLQSAKETLPATKKILRNMAPAQFQSMEAVAFVVGKDGFLVFLVPVYDASGSISLFFDGQSEELRLKRMDVIDYNGFYKRGQSMNKTPPKNRK